MSFVRLTERHDAPVVKTAGLNTIYMEERVRKNTATAINTKIDAQIKESIAFYLPQEKGTVTQRIKALEKEWDVERALEVNMPIVALIGLSLGIFVSSWWFIFPAVVLLFFLEHALQGWCPPLPIFRKLGFRTKREIEKERYALKFLRGDFDTLFKSQVPTPGEIYKAVNKE
jgi:hypothetical protein